MSLMPDTAFSQARRVKTGQAEARRYMGRVASLGCIVCREQKGVFSPAEVHHIRFQVGIGRRASHYDTLPLCPLHHRTGGYGTAYHAGPGIWETTFGRQTEMLERVREMLK